MEKRLLHQNKSNILLGLANKSNFDFNAVTNLTQQRFGKDVYSLSSKDANILIKQMLGE